MRVDELYLGSQEDQGATMCLSSSEGLMRNIKKGCAKEEKQGRLFHGD